MKMSVVYLMCLGLVMFDFIECRKKLIMKQIFRRHQNQCTSLSQRRITQRSPSDYLSSISSSSSLSSSSFSSSEHEDSDESGVSNNQPRKNLPSTKFAIRRKRPPTPRWIKGEFNTFNPVLRTARFLHIP